jgi:FKBP-type peptidyl-prolyl cis-trans isomerase
MTMEDVASFNYVGYFLDSLGHPIIFDNTIERNTPAILRPGASGTFPGLAQGLTYLGKGDKAKIFVPEKLAFGNKRKGIIPPNTALIYDIEILNTQKYPFFDVKGLDTIKSSSGLKYIQVRKTDGVAVDTGSNVTVAYTGFTIDSLGYRKIFDASRESHKMLEFTLGKGKVIKGFDEGVKGMRVGEGRRIIIPYTLGYGENGLPDAGIPGKATIYFDVELVEIKK